MGPLWRRSSSVSETTFIATTVILVILLVAAVVAFIITFLRHIHRPETVSLPLTPSNSRSFSRHDRAPPQQQQQAPPRQRQPSNTRTINRTSISSPHAATRTSPHPTSTPARPLLPYTPNVPPASLANTRSAEALRRDALMARLAAMPLTSDTTDDMGPDAPALEVVNRSYAEWVIKRRGADADPSAAMLIGSDEGTTDAGGGAGGAGAGYAALFARREEGEEYPGAGVGNGRGNRYAYARDEMLPGGKRGSRGLFGGTIGTERGRRGFLEEEEDDEEPLTPKPPLPVALRKVRSDPHQ